MPKSASAGGLGHGFPWARYYDLAHGNPISDTDTDSDFNFKKMCPRTFYQSLHKDLGDYLEQHLGYRPEIELEDGRRAEKVLVDGAKKKVGEMDRLSREMDELSLLDEVGDMRGASRKLDVHEAPARPRDNQVL